MMITKRASGILLHPTSLPGPHGSGDFGADAYRFIDWLKEAGQTYWQILPLGEIGPGNSPYMSCSAFAGNVLMIDLEELESLAFLNKTDLNPPAEFNSDHVDYPKVINFRMDRLHLAATNFFNHPSALRPEYDTFCSEERAWLDDYALFKTLEKYHSNLNWNQWTRELAQRNHAKLKRVKKLYPEELNFWKFCQWCFARQWFRLKHYAQSHGIVIIGDLPIFVAYQSVDLWSHQDLFELDEAGQPLVVAGVPPDYYSETGQLWGNPLYRWETHITTGYAWWIERLSHALKFFDLVRIDHFRGFSACWAVPANADTAAQGSWQPGPGALLFQAMQNALGHLPIIAEDLGLITNNVIELRDAFKFPGMRILQFAFGGDLENTFLPHHYIANTVAYTGTHDNDTILGWWNTLPESQKSFALQYLNCNPDSIRVEMMRALANSVANTVIFPLQDALALSGESRMNFPGTATGNWSWRFNWKQILPIHTQFLKDISQQSNRID
jgi:4-alpha-glucanotransferase